MLFDDPTLVNPPWIAWEVVIERLYRRFHMTGDHHDLSFTIGDEETLKRRRYEMERVAAKFEGMRSRLMNASHAIQLQLDRRRRG